MKLRTQILLFLFIFGLTPLFASVAINFPMIMDGLELFYHKAHLQNLRADFRDLDQHLASRHETVRLLAKFPEYGKLLGATDNNPGSTVGVSQARYTDWVNRILNDQLDIIQILFVNKEGREQFWLERDPNTLELVPGVLLRDKPAQAFINAGML
ncbi:MAG: histidine kinase, partial [Gammaproteobacteria bacterium]|nr:histidine kinase [Gammaproteobacteria bacterium]